jgi:hypothetical protein
VRVKTNIKNIKKRLHMQILSSESSPPVHNDGSEKSVLNLSEHVLTESKESVLKRGLNFAARNRVSNLDMVCAAESARSKPPPALRMEFCWRIRCMLEKSKPLTFNITRKESMALKSLKDNK